MPMMLEMVPVSYPTRILPKVAKVTITMPTKRLLEAPVLMRLQLLDRLAFEESKVLELWRTTRVGGF